VGGSLCAILHAPGRPSIHNADAWFREPHTGVGVPLALTLISMAPRLGCPVLLLPFVELFLLIQMGGQIGATQTVIWVGVSALLGLTILRTQGVQTLARLQGALAGGGSPGRALVDGASLWIGGALLLVPGPVTDVLGLVLIFPLTRRLLQGWALARLMRGVRSGAVRVSMMGMDARTPSGGTHGSPLDDPDDRPPRPGEIIQP